MGDIITQATKSLVQTQMLRYGISNYAAASASIYSYRIHDLWASSTVWFSIYCMEMHWKTENSLWHA